MVYSRPVQPDVRALRRSKKRLEQARALTARFARELAAEAARLNGEGMSYADLAVELDVSRSRAQQIVEEGRSE